MLIYHFTDPRNIPSIRRYGLSSWSRLIQQDISHYPASNAMSRELDRRKNLEDSIHFCLRPCHPMANMAPSRGRVVKRVWLAIDSTVIYWRSTRLSSTNAASSRAVIDYCQDTALRSDDIQAEVLVPGFLNSRFIRFP